MNKKSPSPTPIKIKGLSKKAAIALYVAQLEVAGEVAARPRTTKSIDPESVPNILNKDAENSGSHRPFKTPVSNSQGTKSEGLLCTCITGEYGEVYSTSGCPVHYPLTKPGSKTSGNWEEWAELTWTHEYHERCSELKIGKLKRRRLETFIRQILTQARTEVLNEVRDLAYKQSTGAVESILGIVITLDDLTQILNDLSLETGMDEKEEKDG